MTEILESLAGSLRCPKCGAPLQVGPTEVICSESHHFGKTCSYLDLSTEFDEITSRTLTSFGYEWNAFDTVAEEEESYWRWYFADVCLGDLAGSVALDAGCGKGRFTRFTAEHVAAMVALDGSTAVEAAARNLAHLDNVIVVKADLRAPVLAPESFDFVSCLGVLHHLAEPEEGFTHLVKSLRPGGQILIYVYSRPDKRGVRSAALSAAATIRRLSTRLPHRLLRPLASPIAACLYTCVVIPGAIGERHAIEQLQGLPLSVYRGKPLRALWLDTFDRLSAPLEARYRPEEIAAWFDRAGLEIEALREDAGIFALGRRPAST